MNHPSTLRELLDRWLDWFVAGASFVACEFVVINNLRGDGQHYGQTVLNGVVVAAMTLPMAWRRRAPFGVACVVMVALTVLAATLPNFNDVALIGFVVLVAPYAVAAYEQRPRAVLGLAVCLAGFCLPNVIDPSGAGSWLLSVGMCIAAWAAGRAVRARRSLAQELERRAAQIAAEQQGRERLAIAEERSRIARELQELVAHSLSAMVVHSEAAQRLLDSDPERADDAMAVVEDTGREALTEMRSILGILRHANDRPELAPQPGVGQIHALVEAARGERRQVDLHVTGDPGPLPASVDLGVYRILEEGLTSSSVGIGAAPPMEIVLRFGESDVALEMTLRGAKSLNWPTIAIRERVALCDGALEIEALEGAGESLLIRLPRTFEEVLS
jgi:signal transduction histidine kinase